MLKKSLIDSGTFFKNHLGPISLIILPIVVPIEILTVLYQYFITGDEPALHEQLSPLFIDLIAYPIYTVGVIFYIASTISGEKCDTKTLWKLGVKFWLPYTLLSILLALVIMSGFILLVIPGIIFIIRYAFSEFDLLLNQNKPLDAMRSSWDSTKDYMWVILGGYLVITAALYVPYYLVASLFDESSMPFLVFDTASNMVYSVLWVLYTIFSFRVYEFAVLQHNQTLNQDAP